VRGNHFSPSVIQPEGHFGSVAIQAKGDSGVLNDILGTSSTFDIVPHLAALLIAYVLALPIGWDREHEERSAGLRTFPLVAVASCGFIQCAEGLTQESPEAMARIIEGIITGMGFIGGGAILRNHASVRGTATAASLWATGAVGTAAGLGAYDVAVALSVVTFVTLKCLTPLKKEVNGVCADDEISEEKSPPAGRA
jgi:putative Mg2+ transporter-C (MgtC) family protein